MAITYSKGNSDSYVGTGAPTSSPHLTLVAAGVSIVFIVVAAGLWFGFAQSKKALEQVPEAIIPLPATQEIQQARVYEAIDGMEQCHKNTPDLGDAALRKKRQGCYYAVMTIFATSSVCDLVALDTLSLELCRQAQKRFAADYPNGMQTESVLVPQKNTNTTQGTGSTQPSNKNTNSGTGSNQSNTNTNTNTNSGSNSNANSTTSGSTNTNVAAAGNTNTSGNQNANTNTNQTDTSPNDTTLCVNDPGEIVLLEHTNECQ